jgi:hypothetical protein
VRLRHRLVNATNNDTKSPTESLNAFSGRTATFGRALRRIEMENCQNRVQGQARDVGYAHSRG